MKKMTPLREWCRLNGIGLTNAYSLANRNLLHLVKCGRKSYITDDESERFIKSLPAYKAENAGA